MIRSNRFGLAFISLVLILGIFTLNPLSFADLYEKGNQSSFDLGTYFQTFYNSSQGSVQLNTTFSTGNYTSEVFNSTGFARWNNITWIEGAPYGEELPINEGFENVPGGINMSGNTLYLRLNNDAAFGESSTNVYDYSGNQRNGTVVSSPSVVTGKFGNGYSFPGSSTAEYIDVDYRAADGLNDLTVSFWAIVDTNSQGGIISGANSARNNEFLFFLGGNTLGVYLNDANDNFAISVNDGNWHHFVFTRTGTSGTLYVDGDSGTGATVDGGQIDIDPGGLLIGQEQDSVGGGFAAGQAFDGTVDEVAIWNRVLNSSEITSLYVRGIADLNISVRSCNDENCSGETFSTEYNSSPQNLSEANNSYFQFRADFASEDLNYRPELLNVTVDYDLLDTTPPFISLIDPANNTVNSSSNIPEFVFNVTDNEATTLSCDLILNETVGGTATIYGTNSSVINGTTTTIVSSPLADNLYNWWVSCSDELNTNISEMRLINISIGDNVSPIVTSLSPLNNTINTTNTTPAFTYNVTDDVATSLSCNVYINETSGGTLRSIGSTVTTVNTSDTIVSNETLANDEYLWYVECSDGNNLNVTENRTISIAVDTFAPNVTLLTPTDQDGSVSFSSVSYSCRVTDDFSVANVSLYADHSGTYELISTQSGSGDNYTATFNLSIERAQYFDERFVEWNCLAYDDANRSSYAPSNFTYSNWDLGTATNLTTEYTQRVIELIGSNGSGSYVSSIKSGIVNTTWGDFNVTIPMPYGSPYPSNAGIDTGYSRPVNMSGNVLLLSLDEDPTSNGGTSLDSSGQSNDGTVTTNNGATNKAVTGIFNNSFSFDGSGDYVQANAVMGDIANSDTTILAWMRTSSTSQQFAIGINTNSGGNRLMIGNRGSSTALSVFDQGAGGWQDSGVTYGDGEWRLVGVIIDDSTGDVDVIIDGQVVDEYTTSQSFASTDQFHVGMETDGGSASDFFNGDIDEVMIFNRTLSTEEIERIYERGAVQLNVSVRSCDDSSCTGESFTQLNSTSENLTSIVGDNIYFQYLLNFSTTNSSLVPQVENVSIGYVPSNFSVPEINYTNVSVWKAIESFDTNFYLVKIGVENPSVNATNVMLWDFVDQDFIFGSFNVLYDLNYTVSGEYNGTILGWNISLLPNEETEINYSVISTNTTDYKVLRNWRVGVE